MKLLPRGGEAQWLYQKDEASPVLFNYKYWQARGILYDVNMCAKTGHHSLRPSCAGFRIHALDAADEVHWAAPPDHFHLPKVERSWGVAVQLDLLTVGLDYTTTSHC